MTRSLGLDGFRVDRTPKDDGLGSGTSLFSGSTKSFSLPPLLSLSASLTFQPPQDNLTSTYRASSSPQPTTIMTPKLLNAINVVNSHAQAGPSPILNPNLSVVPTAKNPDQLIKDAKNVLTAVATIRAAQNNGGGQQGQQPAPVAATVTPVGGASTSLIGQGTFSPVKTSSSTPVYTSGRNAKADTSVYSASAAPPADPQIATASIGGPKVADTSDVAGRCKNVGNFFADSGIKGAVVDGGDTLKKVVKDTSLTLASATQANRMSELKPSPDFVAKFSLNGGMSLPKPGAIG